MTFPDSATVTRSAPEDCHDLAAVLRTADRLECQASGHSPLAALTAGYWNGNCWTVKSGSTVLAMFGVSPHLEAPEFGVVWLLAAPELLRFKAQFLRESRLWVEELGRGYAVIGNHCDERNEVAIRWLRWLGFTFHDRHPVGDTHFLSFYKVT